MKTENLASEELKSHSIASLLVAEQLPGRSDQALLELLKEVERYAENTTSGNATPRFAALESFIPVRTSEPLPDTNLLAIDIGGTYTRVALRCSDFQANTDWIPLFLLRNYELVDSQSQTSAFKQMRDSLVQSIKQKLAERKIAPEQIAGLGVVWSNALRSYSLKGANQNASTQIRGTSGLVTGKDSGEFYLKGEPWNPDLRDGDDIGKFLIEGFLDAGFALRAFVIANDTVLTQKVIPESTAGMVASTGVNTTLILPGERRLRNSEAGNAFLIPEKLQHPADRIPGDVYNIEALVAGRGMQRRLGAHLHYLCKLPGLENLVSNSLFNRLQQISAALEAQQSFYTEFKGKDLQALLQGNYSQFLTQRAELQSLFDDSELLELLSAIAHNLSQRGGTYAAILAYGSLYLQLKEGRKDLILALDSSQAHLLPAYWPALLETFSKICQDRFPDLTPEVRLIDVSGDRVLSVPMFGAARAVNDFLSRDDL